MTYVFPADLPSILLFVQLRSDVVALLAEPDDDVALDRAKRAHRRCAGRRGHCADGVAEGRRRGGRAVVCELLKTLPFEMSYGIY